jgi:hypothetical protein
MNHRSLYTAAAVLTASLLVLTAGPSQAVPAYVTSSSALCTSLSTTLCYTNVNTAISDAMAGKFNIDSIKIYPGTYSVASTPDTVLTKGITISGTSTAGTILDGGGGGSPILQINKPTATVTISNLTFYNAATGIGITNSANTIKIHNNIFELGAANTAIKASSSTPTNVENNVFYRDGQGIVSDTPSLSSITNNIFEQEAGGVAISPLVGLGSIFNNLFDGGTPGPAVEFNDQSVDYKGNLDNVDPLFVDPANASVAKRDFHLTSSSPCIDTGAGSVGNDPVGNATPDMGAYGGPGSDTVPNTVIVSSATFSASSISLIWKPNPDYNVTGYKVYYDTTSHVSSGDYEGTGAAEGPSPIDAGNVTSFVLSGLTATVTTPTVPTLNQPTPVNGGLILSWSAVNGASSYNIYYHLVSSTTTEFVIHGITATSFTLTGLTNGEWYAVQVTAVSQATDYLAVTAYYLTGGKPGVSMESAYSAEQKVPVGTAMESARSGEVQGLPEAIVPYPNLPNSGCFIATAAYDSADAGPVMVLRLFRDRYLLGNAPGRAFISWYYRNSPSWARSLNQHPAFKPLVRVALAPVVALAYLANTLSPSFAAALMLLLAAAAVLASRRMRNAGSRTC